MIGGTVDTKERTKDTKRKGRRKSKTTDQKQIKRQKKKTRDKKTK
jgi:hypothetical protein